MSARAVVLMTAAVDRFMLCSFALRGGRDVAIA
jgi:hypothetical protein